MQPIDTETVDTPAGEYVIAWHTDEVPEQPYNEGLGFAFDGAGDRIDVAAGDHADEILAVLQSNTFGWRHTGQPIYRHSSAGIARYLRMKYGLTGIREVSYDYDTSDPSTDRDRVHGIAWAPSDVPADRAGDWTDAAIAEYRAWAEGDCFGWTVTGPDGETIDDCWGYFGYDEQRSYTRQLALDAVKNDAQQRCEKSNLVGAGFIGLI